MTDKHRANLFIQILINVYIAKKRLFRCAHYFLASYQFWGQIKGGIVHFLAETCQFIQHDDIISMLLHSILTYIFWIILTDMYKYSSIVSYPISPEYFWLICINTPPLYPNLYLLNNSDWYVSILLHCVLYYISWIILTDMYQYSFIVYYHISPE